MNRRSIRLTLISSLIVLLAACQTMPLHRVHQRVVDSPELLPSAQSNVVIMPLSVTVKELSAGGLQDEVGDWTRLAQEHIHASLQSGGALKQQFHVSKPGQMTAAEHDIVNEHIALFDAVAGSALGYTMKTPVDDAWKDKAKHFDYTLGPGLGFIAERTGADKALFIFGEDVVSSSGRKAAFIVAAAFGVVLPLGHSYLIAGIVDLHSGDILWLDYSLSGDDRTFRERADIDALLSDLFADYPGIDTYVQGVRSP